MKIVTHERGRTTMLVPLDELRPVEGADLVATVGMITERYSFHWPVDLNRPYSDVVGGPLVFRGGRYAHTGEIYQIDSLEIFSDGLVVNSSSTQRSDLILADFVKWGMEALGFRSPRTKPRLSNSSTIIVDFERDIESIVNPRIVALVSDAMKNTINAPIWKLGNLGFVGVTSETDTPNSAVQFNIQRRTEIPLYLNRYFSSAPLSTPNHEAFLQQLEALGIEAARH